MNATDNRPEAQWDNKPDVLQESLSDRLKKSLRLSGKSVGDIAEMLEIHRNTVSGWLAGRARPAPLVLRFWATECGVPLEWLLTGEWPEAPPAAAVKKAVKKVVEYHVVPEAAVVKKVAKKAPARTAGKPTRAASKKR